MVKDWLIPVAIVVIGLVVYNLLVKRFIPDGFDATRL